MPKGIYKRTSDMQTGKYLRSKQAKINISNGKKEKLFNHISNCKCPFCKAKRGELKGSKNYFYDKHHTEETKKKISLANKGRKCSKEIVIKKIQNAFKALRLKPNKSEKKLTKLLNQILPNEYKYVGNGKMIIERFNPDFINANGQKKIIELYGDYWHNREDIKKRDKNRLRIYSGYGYKTLIIWENELKDFNKLREKILNFNSEV